MPVRYPKTSFCGRQALICYAWLNHLIKYQKTRRRKHLEPFRNPIGLTFNNRFHNNFWAFRFNVEPFQKSGKKQWIGGDGYKICEYQKIHCMYLAKRFSTEQDCNILRRGVC